MDFVLPPCLTTRAALRLPTGDAADRSDLSRRACKDAAMPIANGLLQRHLPLEMSYTSCETLCVARRDGMAEEPSRTPPQLSAVVRAGAGGGPADFEALETLCAAHSVRGSATERAERPCSHAATPPAVPTPTFWTCGAAFLPRPRPAPAHQSDTGLPPLTPVRAPDHTATKAWRPRAPSSPSTTTARP